MTITEESIEVGVNKWFYRQLSPEKTNDNPPVLFLHGLPSMGFTWCEIMPLLAEKGFQAIAPDWLGHGFSSKPDPRDFPYTPDAYIQALEALITALEWEKFSLVVQGFLGSVGINYALRNPDKIERLIILNAPLSTNAKLPWKMSQWGIPFVGDMLTQDPLLVDRTLEGGSGFVISDQNLDVYRRPFLQSSSAGRSLVATIKNLKLSSSMAELESGLPKFGVQTQIIWGMADPWLVASDAETLASSNPRIELVKLNEAKHYPQEHFPQEVGELIVNFLRRQTL